MAIRIWQTFGERANVNVDDGSVEIFFALDGSEDSDDVYEAIDDAFGVTIPSTYQGLPFETYQLEHLGAGVWRVSVKYSNSRVLQAGEQDFQIDTSAGREHVERSLETVASYGTDPPDFGNLVGVNEENVAGVDIVDAQPQYTVVKKFIAADLDEDYCDNCSRAIGSFNSDNFKFQWLGQVIDCDAGELTLIDFTARNGGVEAGVQLIEATFKFQRQFNRDDITVGEIGPIVKDGNNYLWVRWEQSADADTRVRLPQAVYVERLYRPLDFSLFGID